MPRNVAKADKTTRCIALLIALERAKRGIQLRPFFEHRGWCWRSAYRDIDTLRRAGVPIEQRERGWFRVADGWSLGGAVDIKREELAALSAARRLAPALGELDSLWGKLSGSSQLSLGFDTWLDTRAPSIDYVAHRTSFQVLQRAIREHCVVRIRYRKLTGEESDRLVEPAFVRWEPSAEAYYLVGWCRARQAVRTFAIHRIVTVEITPEFFTQRKNAVADMGRAFRLWGSSNAEHVSLVFSPNVAQEVRERRWHASEVISELPDGALRIEMDIAAPHELERLLLGYGPDVLVEAPAGLATRVRELHAACSGVDRFDMRRVVVHASRGHRRVDTR